MSDMGFSCPICNVRYSENEINQHVNNCLNKLDDNWDDDQMMKLPPDKKVKLDDGSTFPMLSSSQSSIKLLHNISAGHQFQTEADVTSKEDGEHNADTINNDQQDVKLVQNAFTLLQKNSNKSLLHTTQSPQKSKFASQSPNTKGKHSSRGNIQKHSACLVKQTAVSSSTPEYVSDNTSSTSFSKEVLGNQPLSASGQKTLPSRQCEKPLAERLRPTSMDDYIGQDHVMGQGHVLRQLITSFRIPSMILWGPPGCGKTTLGRIISAKCEEINGIRFVQLSAAIASLADVKEVIKVAKNEQKSWKRQTVLFMDEIHRFNKLQQDSFLPHVEDGTIILVGATTENPSFYINNALLSRCKVVVLEKLSVPCVEKILYKGAAKLGLAVLSDKKEKKGKNDRSPLSIEQDAISLLASYCDGDARSALNTLQAVTEGKVSVHCDGSSKDEKVITVDDVNNMLQQRHIQYDKTGEEHYNCISALQKSIRGSDDNAAIYWLARMLEGGEDPLYIARRLVICASEDIGLADQQALVLAVACQQACHFLGMPECSINLAHCVTYLARAPKSNETYVALNRARDLIRNHHGSLPSVPLHLRNAPTKLMKNLGYGKGYKYNHNFSEPVEQDYLPKDMKGVDFFKKM